MKITFEILGGILEGEMMENSGLEGSLRWICSGMAGREIKHIRLLNADTTLQSNTLYLQELQADELSGFSQEEIPREGIQILFLDKEKRIHFDERKDQKKSSGKNRGGAQRRSGTETSPGKQPDSYEDRVRYSLRKGKVCEEDRIAVYKTPLSADMVLEKLMDSAAQLLRWNSLYPEGILKQKDTKDLFGAGEEILCRDYAIVDVDMKVAYCTGGYEKSRSVKNGLISEEIVQDLAAHKEFHDAAFEKTSFYYYNPQTDTNSYCHNIVANGQYIARLVMILWEEEKELCEGVKEVFEIFASHVQEIYTHMNLIRGQVHRSDDDVHRFCRFLLEGGRASDEMGNRVLHTYHWKMEHRFFCVILRFLAGSQWNAQLLIMLPYLAERLESLWENSCAVTTGDEILLTVNAGCWPEGASIHSFQQELAYFVRDNMCKAGVSPEFSGFSLLSDAKKAAVAALEIGSMKRPDFWYYLFEDYRLDCLCDSLLKELPAEFLCHPAIRILEEYDREHTSELLKTLQVWLECSGNMTEASKKLYIHRTSFCRRMNQIRKLTGVPLEKPDVVFLLSLSCQILRFEKPEPFRE